jgi:hypothetical protein
MVVNEHKCVCGVCDVSLMCLHLSRVHQLGGEHALPLEGVEGVHVNPVC